MYEDETRAMRPRDGEAFTTELKVSKRRPDVFSGLGALVVLTALFVGAAAVLGLVAGAWWFLFQVGWDVIQ